MGSAYNTALLVAAGLNLLVALMHIGVIIKGRSWYHLFGAGEHFVRAAMTGRRLPAVVTAGIALVLASWAAYALSGAGVIEPLPLLRPALCVIILVYLLRGLLGPFVLAGTGRSTRFIMISSGICVVYGLMHLVGLMQVWNTLA